MQLSFLFLNTLINLSSFFALISEYNNVNLPLNGVLFAFFKFIKKLEQAEL